MKSKTITFASIKGGVGKTVLMTACAVELAKKGFKVLIIDLDSNQTTSENFGFAGEANTSHGLMSGDIIEPIKAADNIDIIPSELRNCMMSNVADKCLLNSIKKNDYGYYDYIFIDPPGTWHALVRNAIRASDIIILPGKPASMDLEPINLLIDQMENLDLPQEPDVWAVLNEWDVKRNQNNIFEAYQELGEMFYPHPITAMKSFRNLAEDVYNYNLVGSAKKQINKMIEEMGI